MLSGRTQQYIRSEYIQPPPGPPTLDAKKSPLALLAQTCSAIGKDLSSSSPRPSSINVMQPVSSNRSPSSSPGSGKAKNLSLTNSNSTPVVSNNDAFEARSNQSPSNESSKHSAKSTQQSTATAVNSIPPTRSPVNVTDHYGAIINSKRQSPALNCGNKSASKSYHLIENNKSNYPAYSSSFENNAKFSTKSSPQSPLKSTKSLSCDTVSPKDHRDEMKKRRRLSRTKSPKQVSESKASPTNMQSSTSPNGEKQDVNITKSTSHGTTTIPPPHTAYLLGGKTPPPSHKQHGMYSSMVPCADRFCVGCQLSHIPGACDINSIKNSQTQNLLSLYSGLDPLVQNMGMAAGTLPSSYALQSQFMLAAIAARNEVPSGYEHNVAPHMCNWVNATEGTCGKRFNTADELIEHLKTHAVPTDYATNAYALDKAYAAVGTNPFSSYLNHPGLSFPGAINGISASSHLASVALANERLLQSSQRRTSPLYRYHPYKSASVPQVSTNSYLPLIPPTTAASSLYCSPYTFYGQPVAAPSTGYVFP